MKTTVMKMSTVSSARRGNFSKYEVCHYYSHVKADYTAIFINLQLKAEMQNFIPFLSFFGGVRRRYQPFSYVKASLFFLPLGRTSP